MKRLLLLVFMLPMSVLAAGVHVDDIEYQDWLNKLIPHFTAVIRAVELANNAADEVDQVKGTDNTVQFCGTLFTGTGYDCTATTGDQWILTDGLEKLMNRSQQMYGCATNQTCNASERLRGLRRFTNELSNADQESTLNVKYQRLVSNMVNNARTLLESLLEADIVNEQADEVEADKTDLQLCQQFFPGASCVADNALSLTQDLKLAAGAMDSLFDCANNIACGTDTRLMKMRHFVEIE